MSVARSSLIFAFGTLLSRVSGLARDAVVTGVFGATTLLDAFLVANRIPNLFREMLAEGALGSAFTKVYAGLSEQDKERAQHLLGDTFRLGLILLGFVTVAGALTAPLLVKLFTLGASEVRSDNFIAQTTGLTRLLFPFLGLATLSALAMGALHQSGRFFITSFTPIFLNIGYILGALVFSSWFTGLGWVWIEVWIADPKVVGLSVGVLLGGLLHFLAQFFALIRQLKKLGLEFRFSSKLITSDLRNVIALMIPAAVAASTASINLLVNTNFATSLETGAVTWLNFAFRLLQLPIGLFAVAVGVAALPALTRAVAAADHRVDERVNQELQNAVELILWLMAPCMVFLLLNHLPAVQLLFQHGRFDQASAYATSSALFAYSFGVLGYGLIKVLTSFYFAVERTKFAMKVSLIAVLVNFFGNWLLVKQLGHVGLAATSALTLSFNAACLAWGLKGSGVVFEWRKLLKSMSFMVLAGLIAALLQRFCLDAISALNLAGPFGLKASAALILAANSLVTAVCFGGLGLIYLRWSPADAFNRIKSLRR